MDHHTLGCKHKNCRGCSEFAFAEKRRSSGRLLANWHNTSSIHSSYRLTTQSRPSLCGCVHRSKIRPPNPYVYGHVSVHQPKPLPPKLSKPPSYRNKICSKNPPHPWTDGYPRWTLPRSRVPVINPLSISKPQTKCPPKTKKMGYREKIRCDLEKVEVEIEECNLGEISYECSDETPKFHCISLVPNQTRVEFVPWDFLTVRNKVEQLYALFPEKACNGDQISIRLTGDDVGIEQLNTLGTAETVKVNFQSGETITWVYCGDLQPHWRIFIEGGRPEKMKSQTA